MFSRRSIAVIQVGVLLSVFFLSYPVQSASSTSSLVPTEKEKKIDATATMRMLTDEGLRHQKAGQFEAAVEKYKAALSLAQETQTSSEITTALLGLLGNAYVHLRRWQDVVESSTQAIHINPANATAHQLLGLAYSELRRSQEAEAEYREAIRLRPDYTEAYHGLGLLYQHLHRYREAEEAFKAAIRSKPDFTFSYLQLGLMYNEMSQELNRQGRYAEAVRFGEQALAIFEKNQGSDHLDTVLFLNNLALLYDAMGEYSKALPLYQRALTIQEKALGPGHPNIVTVLNKIAQLHKSRGEYTKARSLFERALSIREKTLGLNHSSTVQSLNSLAMIYEDTGEYPKALPLYQRVLAILEKTSGGDHPDTAIALNNLALLYSHIGEYSKALPLYRRALAIREKTHGPDQLDVAISLTNLADLYRNMGEYTKALPLSQRALVIIEKALGPNHPDTARFINNLASLYFSMGEYKKALSLTQQVLMVRENTQGPDHPATASALNNLAALYNEIGEYAKALPLHQRALAIREKVLGPDHPDTALSLGNLAGLYRSMGDYAKALPFYRRALAIGEKGGGPNRPDVAVSLNNLAALYHDIRDDEKALQFTKRALMIQEKVLGPEHPDTALSLNNLAALYNEIGKYAEAIPLHEQALAIREKTLGPNHPDTALSLNNLASSYAGIREYAKALLLHQRALVTYEKALGPNHPSTALSLNNLATTHMQMRNYAEALPLLQQALAIYERSLGPDHPSTVIALINLAVAHQSTGDYAKAFQFFQRALAVDDSTFANVFSIASEDQKLSFAQKSLGTYWNALSLIHRHFLNDARAVRFGLELVLRRKGIVLDAQARTQEALTANLKGETLEAWQRLTQHRSILSRILLRGSGELKPEIYKKRIEELQAAITKEEEFLAQHSGLVAQELAQRQVTAQMLASHLPKDSALVEFVHIRDWDEKKNKWSDTERYLAFVLTPGNQVTLTDLGEATKIDSSIKAALTAINPPDFERAMETYSRQADTELSDLYRLLLEPLETAIGPRKRLIVSPDGELNKVPFVALRTPDGHYLVEKMTLSYVASGRDLLRGKTDIAPTVDLLLVANPAFDDKEVLQVVAASGDALRAADYGKRKFRPLPGTAQEARVLPPLIKGTHKVLEGKQATESAVHATMSPKVLHLATHGFFLKDEDTPLPAPLTRIGNDHFTPVRTSPMVRSGLALAGANNAQTIATGDDGLLTALEVSGMNLYGTDLVVLSACETAVGDVKVGEGVYGLRRAFVLAGAKNLAMSLWPVGDETTRSQMETFYKAYGQGQSPAEALRQAQLQTIANLRELTATMKEPLVPVRSWAPFIVQQTGE